MRDFLIIAHRGASGYLPENTLESATMAHAMGADFIEMDVVLTRDDVPVVYHDLYLDDLVETPSSLAGRKRDDRRHYLADFDWEEIRGLHVHPRVSGNGMVSCPEPADRKKQPCCIASLDEMVRAIHRLNVSAGRAVGLYIEPKAPDFHAQIGKDVFAAVMGCLASSGVSERGMPVNIQSFDVQALRKARGRYGTGVTLVQLMDEASAAALAAGSGREGVEAALGEIAEHANGIGPPVSGIFKADGTPVSTHNVIGMAHAHGLFVHLWHGLDDRLPLPFHDIDSAMSTLVAAEVDGIFTDQPNLVGKNVPRALWPTTMV